MSAFSSLPVSTYLDSFYCSSRSSTPKWKEEEESSRSSDSIPSLLSVLFSSLRVSKVLSFLLQWIRILFCLISKSESVRCLVLCNFLRPHGPTRLLCPWDSPSKNTGVGCQSLLQGSSQPRHQTWSPTLQADSLLSEPPQCNTNHGS